MFCINCGIVLDENAKFCPNCGTRISVMSSIEDVKSNVNIGESTNEKIGAASSNSFATYRTTAQRNITENDYKSADITTPYIAKEEVEEKGDIRSNVRVLTIIASIVCPIAGIILGIIHICKGKTTPGVVYLVCGMVTAIWVIFW